jgi:hypothetical protein
VLQNSPTESMAFCNTMGGKADIPDPLADVR